MEVTAKLNTIFLAKFRAEYKIFMFIERLGKEGRKDRVMPRITTACAEQIAGSGEKKKGARHSNHTIPDPGETRRKESARHCEGTRAGGDR